MVVLASGAVADVAASSLPGADARLAGALSRAGAGRATRGDRDELERVGARDAALAAALSVDVEAAG